MGPGRVNQGVGKASFTALARQPCDIYIRTADPQRPKRNPVNIARMIRLVPTVAVLCLSACTTPSGTGTNDTSKLCGGESGFGARIQGLFVLIDMCVPEEKTLTTLGQIDPNRYCVTASYTEDSLTIEVEMSFIMQIMLPRKMNPTSDQLTGFLDPAGVWVQYRETRPGFSPLRSDSVSGNFTLTFSDSTVIVATFDNMYIGLVDTTGQTSVRKIESGFLSVIPDI